MSLTLEHLLKKYDVTLDIDELADVLKRRPGGVRATLSMRSQAWAIELNKHKVYIGRRVHYPVEQVAKLLAGKLTEKRKSK